MRTWLQPGAGELCELERTAEEFGLDLDRLVRSVALGRPEMLDDSRWSSMDNADSSDPLTWGEARSLAEEYGRDFDGIVAAFESGVSLPMPLVLDRGDDLYLVGGNTRLMACRVLGIRPEVWVFRYQEKREDAATD